MKRLSLGASRRSKGVDLNMSPLIDMVFILLIFFLVTTSFVKEAAVEVKQPLQSNQPPMNNEDTNLMLEISKEGYIYIIDPVAGSIMVDIRSVRSRMERWYSENPLGSVLIISNPECRWGVSIEVLDKARAVGIKNVAVTKATG